MIDHICATNETINDKHEGNIVVEGSPVVQWGVQRPRPALNHASEKVYGDQRVNLEHWAVVQVNGDNWQHDSPHEVAQLKDHAPWFVDVVDLFDQIFMLFKKGLVCRKPFVLRPKVEQNETNDVEDLYYEADPENV